VPSLTFVLPHWLYWAGLILFPLIAMWMVRRAERRPAPGAVSLPLAYMFLITGGFVGIHRFYLRSRLGALYLPLFAGILYSNVKYRAAREVVSGVKRDLMGADFDVERFTKAVAAGADGAAARLESARQALGALNAKLAGVTATLDGWDTAAFALAAAIAAFLLVDAVLLPGLTRRQAAREGAPPRPTLPVGATEAVAGTGEDPTLRVRSRLTDPIDRLSGWTGNFVAYWSVLAVFVYYYEVMARYVFNSPTNWAHESMFLMFGAQYLLSGAFALREDSHVRVDVVYMMLSERGKLIADIITSAFFFLFCGVLLVTGWIFAADSIRVWEVSFTEWAIQYWPVKMTIAIGAALILLQGAARLIKDIVLLRGARS
jgi:TRAP-type mannitol/chloroaromatic compound transport system permease small subunit